MCLLRFVFVLLRGVARLTGSELVYLFRVRGILYLAIIRIAIMQKAALRAGNKFFVPVCTCCCLDFCKPESPRCRTGLHQQRCRVSHDPDQRQLRYSLHGWHGHERRLHSK